ncbi:unnamed protein product, partial [Pylaiella littoralis]
APLAVKIVHTDNGGEFDGEFEEVCRELCIKQEESPPHSPQSNGVAERALGLIKDAARSGLIQAMVIFPDAPNFPSLWAEAILAELEEKTNTHIRSFLEERAAIRSLME